MNWNYVDEQLSRILVARAPWKVEAIRVERRYGMLYRARITDCHSSGQEPRILERPTFLLLAAALACGGYCNTNHSGLRLNH